MNLGDFHTLVQGEIGKGTTHNANIPERVRMAVLWLERNYSFKYMERFVTFTLTARTINLPGEIKNIIFMRTATPTEYKYLRQIDPREVLSNEVDTPSGYWIDGNEAFVFDSHPGVDVEMELSYNQRTTWESGNNAFTHWLLDNATDVLLAKTMQLMSTRARQFNWQQEYSNMLKLGLDTLVMDDEELRNSNNEWIMNNGTG